LIKNYQIEENKIFQITLRDDIYWSDGEKITADDIVYTIDTIINPDFQSELMQQWIGVDVEKISENEVRFILESPSAVFLENLTVKIIPEHIFKGYSAQDFRYLKQNFIPVSSGAYKVKEVKEDSEGRIKSIILGKNPYYFKEEPFIDEINFVFFKNKNALLEANKKGEVDGFVVPDGFYSDFLNNNFTSNYYEINLPRYFSVVFNLRKDNLLKEVDIRKAIIYATNKNEIVNSVLSGKGNVISSPFLPIFYNFSTPEIEIAFDLEKARELIKENGFINGERENEDIFVFSEDTKKDSQGEDVRMLQSCFIDLRSEDIKFYPEGEITGFFDEKTEEAVIYFQEKYYEEILAPHNFEKGTGMVAERTREKLNELCADFFRETTNLEIVLTTLDNPMLVDTAEVLKEQWEKAGFSIIIDYKDINSLREDVIRKRDFDVLLFGTMLAGTPNPLPLWHSTKVDHPGLNLSGYKNSEVDKLLEKIISGEKNKEDEKSVKNFLEEVQETVIQDFVCIPLYNPYLIYYLSEKVKGFEKTKFISSSNRFQDIEQWYIKTKRIWE
ncbi:MAG: ABC transporter substrate-binding protein, partial [Patescibacteria group bacterium]|nr:ABC transporter substrate-binding protein [Patescibacteria group bacterium]